jgi:chondroitin AC lyase
MQSAGALVVLIAGTLLVGGVVHAAPASDLPVIRDRLRAELLAEALTVPIDDVVGYAASLDAQGKWDDIEYPSDISARWPTSVHLHRMVAMAQAHQHPDHPLQSDSVAKAMVHDALQRSLEFWVAWDADVSGIQRGIHADRGGQAPQWWWNHLGTPRHLSRTLILMQPDIEAGVFSSPQVLHKALTSIVARAWPPFEVGDEGRVPATGMNMISRTDVAIFQAAMLGDAALAIDAYTHHYNEVRIAPGALEGIKADMSFHQHGPLLTSGQYGQEFAIFGSLALAAARDTGFADDGDKTAIMTDYLLDGSQWMMRNDSFDFLAAGRRITRPEFAGVGREMLLPVRSMGQIGATRADEFARWADRIENGTDASNALVGNRHFWLSDLMTHHREGFYTPVKLTSSRTVPSESVNNENLRGFHLADGVAPIYRTGREYTDIFPVWDWQRLPGITAEQQPQGAPQALPTWHAGHEASRNRGTFVGGASDRDYGVAAMDYDRDKRNVNLKAKKSWFYLDEGFVALGAGITAPDANNPVFTSLNQALQNGSAVFSVNGVVQPELASGSRVLNGVDWVHHDGVGYFFPGGGDRVTLQLSTRSGSWYGINRTWSQQTLSHDVFSLWIDHGTNPAGAGYSYMVLPGATIEQMRQWSGAPPLSILANTADLQAVRHTGAGMVQAVFHKPGLLRVDDDFTIAVDEAVLLIVREVDGKLRVTVANPENKPMQLTVEVSRRLVEGEGVAWDPAAGTSTITVPLPGGDLAGSSVTRDIVIVPEPAMFGALGFTTLLFRRRFV